MLIKIADFKIPIHRLTRPLKDVLAEALSIPAASIAELRILGESVDARRGPPVICYQFVLRLEGAFPKGQRWERVDESALVPPAFVLPERSAGMTNPIVVGTGPAGIFCALALAMAGAKPIVFDRGFPVEKREADYRNFLSTRALDPESNLLIGEGGAGTFSDGKLYTGTRDPNAAFILQAMVDAGAPPEILYRKRPHIGSDRLLAMAPRLRSRIEELGGTFQFGVRVTDLIWENGRCGGVITASGERHYAPMVFLAGGQGGRDLMQMLIDRGVEYDLKPFQLGCRIEHPQGFIDSNQYHMDTRPAVLEAAEYHLVSRPPDHPHVTTFCMCPGGEIVMASAWPGQLTTNGMSLLARDGQFANSALIVTLSPERCGTAGQAFRLLEDQGRRLFLLGGANYDFPAQDAAGFLRGVAEIGRRGTSVQTGLRAARLDQALVPELTSGMRAALKFFDRQCPGFIRFGRLIGGESCISSPVRFRRDPQTLASSLPGLYLGGEGAGNAGGIMSAAADGLRLAKRMLMEKV